MVTLVEHKSPEYSPRTWYNAKAAEGTVAFAIDFNTAGEHLTKKASNHYLGLSLLSGLYQNVDALLNFCGGNNISVLNIAGNSMHSLKKSITDFKQFDANVDVYNILKIVHEKHPFTLILSGGQTGIDYAAGVACQALGINCIMTFPKGFRQRDEFGEDYFNTYDELMARLWNDAELLLI